MSTSGGWNATANFRVAYSLGLMPWLGMRMKSRRGVRLVSVLALTGHRVAGRMCHMINRLEIRIHHVD
jgi:hypothetical protein